MQNCRKQSDTGYPLFFFMVDSSDHLTGKTGLTPTVTISKNGAGFGSPAGAVAEIANGWYKVAGNATDSNTLGELLLHASSTGADPIDKSYTIVPYDPFDAVRLGLTALPNAAAEAAGGLYTRGAGAGQIAQEDNGAVSINVKTWLRGAIPAVNVTGVPKVDVVDWLGSAPNALQTGRVDAYVGAMAATAVQAIWDALTAALTTVGSIGKRLVDDITGDIYARLGAPAGASIAADLAEIEVETDDIAAIKTKTDSLTFTVAGQIDANVIDWKGAAAPAMTGDAFARLGAPAGASVSADIAEIELETDDIAAIKAKTDNLPSDPADESLVIAATDAIMSRLGAPVGASLSADLAEIEAETDDIAAIKAKTDLLPEGIKKNQAFANFPFSMVRSSDGRTAATGLTITADRRIDGGAFATCANAATEVETGVYSINLEASDLNGEIITFRFAGTGADTRLVTVRPAP